MSRALHELTLAESARLLERRELSPVELTADLLARVEALDPHLGAFITVLGDDARQAAKAAEIAIAAGYHLGPLHGIPIGIKDIIHTRGVRTTAGSRILQDFVPTEDATVVARLRSAGAILIGKLNLHEFAHGVTNVNPHYGTARNPWDRERFPGGSSGGSAVAVAARMCPVALGTDTGASVRLPAAMTGIVGLRPTIGRVSNHGIVTLAWTLDTCGPMTRTVEDCALVLEAIAGYDRQDPHTANIPVPDYREGLTRGLDGVRIGVLTDVAPTLLQADVERSVNEALRTLEGAGAIVRDVSVPDVDQAINALMPVDLAEPSAFHAEWLRTRPEEYGDDVRTLLEAGEMYSATQYIHAQRFRTLLRDRFTDVLRNVDAIVMPTVGFVALPLGETMVRHQAGEEPMISAAMRHTALASVTGLPALSVPCGFSREGLPIGLQLIGRPFDEGTLLGVGHGYQSVTDWHTRAPAV
jgi:aspartyl-tRNA(Asn)/glutamyl-tRNA(Gln) amidotransferase subunit A